VETYPPTGGWAFFPTDNTIKPVSKNMSFTIKRPLTEKYHIASIVLVVQGHEFEAMIDTGSYHGCIRSDLLAALDIPLAGIHTVANPMADDGVRDTMYYTFNFQVKGLSCEYVGEFNFMGKKSPYPLIIGTQFLQECQSFQYLVNENRFELTL